MTTQRLAGSAEELRVSAFPEGRRLWRIAWFGPMLFANRMLKTTQPSVLVHLAEILDPAVRADWDAPIAPDAAASRQVKRWVSVGTTVLLRIGDLWEGQRLFHRPTLETECFAGVQVDETTARVVKAGSSLDEGDFLIPFSEHLWHAENTHSYCVRLTLPDGRFLVIPAMELIRFYFGSSAKLLSALFGPPLQREALYERVKFTPITGRMTLDLASGMPRASAEDIARIAGDRHAWAAALHVGASCLKASTRQEDAYPIAHFPFVGQTDLKVHGQWLSRGSQERGTFLACRIASCSYAFPFKSLTFKLKGQSSRTRRGPAKDAAAGEAASQGTRASTAVPDNPTLEEKDASSRLAPHVYGFRGDRAFPYLEGKLVRGVRAVESTNAASARAGIDAVSELAVGGPGSSARRREADLVEAERTLSVL